MICKATHRMRLGYDHAQISFDGYIHLLSLYRVAGIVGEVIASRTTNWSKSTRILGVATLGEVRASNHRLAFFLCPSDDPIIVSVLIHVPPYAPITDGSQAGLCGRHARPSQLRKDFQRVPMVTMKSGVMVWKDTSRIDSNEQLPAAKAVSCTSPPPQV